MLYSTAHAYFPQEFKIIQQTLYMSNELINLNMRNLMNGSVSILTAKVINWWGLKK